MNLFSSKTKQLDCNWCNAKGKGEENLNLQHCTLVAILTRFGDGNDPEIRLTEEREEKAPVFTSNMGRGGVSLGGGFCAVSVWRVEGSSRWSSVIAMNDSRGKLHLKWSAGLLLILRVEHDFQDLSEGQNQFHISLFIANLDEFISTSSPSFQSKPKELKVDTWEERIISFCHSHNYTWDLTGKKEYNWIPRSQGLMKCQQSYQFLHLLIPHNPSRINLEISK